MSGAIDRILDDVLAAEGGYVNDPADAGGETMYGITVATARSNGWRGPMRELPLQTARDIYRRRYVAAPGFDRVLSRSEALAAELVDTGVNMGPATAAKFLQRALNVLNDTGSRYPALSVDGELGPATLAALDAFLAWRGRDGERVLLKLLNALQGARYVELAEGRAANKKFIFGWIANRVSL